MYTSKIRLALAAIVVVYCSLTSHAQTKVFSGRDAQWLLGVWESKTIRGSIYEQWEQQNDSLFTGRSYLIKGKDTVVMETMRLEQKGKDLCYIPVVKNQNHGKAIIFKALLITSGELIFENPYHDFPQKIMYIRTGTDSLTAEISGVSNGQAKTHTFQMKRIR